MSEIPIWVVAIVAMLAGAGVVLLTAPHTGRAPGGW